ncbi:AAA family ATPase [Sulfitobacter albidus]|uniref:AAA family ATPase n=1 Tax=Sulfitobacter albidus TaxID=2829501 RepID=A0A975JEB9_9RHOB|nr:AAA family ATPase [Sulfitobacter albidus]QUJ76705.1 AAA family ATPase [Sulfitobacter albidus]
MTLAHHDIEDRVAKAIDTPAPRTQVLLLTVSDGLADALYAEMCQDTTVEGRMERAAFADAAGDADRDWSDVDLLVFEASATPHRDADALRALQARLGAPMPCVAVATRSIDPTHAEALRTAGVAEILPLKIALEEDAEPEEDNLFAEESATPKTRRGWLPADAERQHAPRELEAPTQQEAPAQQQAPDCTPPEHAAAAMTGADAETPAPHADESETADDDFDVLIEEPAPEPEPKRRRTVTQGQLSIVMRSRGGAGATTLAVNLAVARAQSAPDSTVALVDLDIQNGAIAVAMDLPDSAAASAWMRGQKRPGRAFLEEAMTRHSSGVDVMTAPDVFAPLSALDAEGVALLLDALKARYDHIVLDLPPAIAEWIDPVLERAERVLIVTDTSLPAIKRTRRLIDLIGEEHMTLPVQVVVNQERRPVIMPAVLKECEAMLGRPLEHWVPCDQRAARRATDLGVPLQISAKRSRMARAIAVLGNAVFVAPAASASTTNSRAKG